MTHKLYEIFFCFPDLSSCVTTKADLVDELIDLLCENQIITYSGYLKKDDLRKDLIKYIGDGNIEGYKVLSDIEKKDIKRIIARTVEKCNKKLPIPTKNYIFVFPWFPSDNEAIFQGSFGFAAYSCVLHLFVSPDLLNEKSLADSIVHEISHTISYHFNFEHFGNWSLLDHIVNEGLAENFREDILKSDPAPWAIALSKKESFGILESLQSFLGSKSVPLQRDILFGNKLYKRWTGYSIGYWLVKEFRRKNKTLSWEETFKSSPQDILNLVMNSGV